MQTLKPWTQFISQHRNSAPLVYLNGVRHSVSKGFYCGMHSHRAIEIVYHPRGRGVTRLEKSPAVAFAEGTVVVYAPNERHDQTVDSAGEDLCVTLAVPARHRGLPRHCFSVDRVEDSSIIEDLRVLSQGRVDLAPTEQAIFNLRATSTLFALVQLAQAGHSAREPSAEKYVEKAEHYIRENFASPIALRDAAAHAGIGYDHLRHVVRATRGRSLVRYLTEVRIERAKTLLVHSQIPLKQVAAQCGFRDEYYFSAVFRRMAGSPPGRYRTRRQ